MNKHEQARELLGKKYYDKTTLKYHICGDKKVYEEYSDWWLLDYATLHELKRYSNEAEATEKELIIKNEMIHILTLPYRNIKDTRRLMQLELELRKLKAEEKHNA